VHRQHAAGGRVLRNDALAPQAVEHVDEGLFAASPALNGLAMRIDGGIIRSVI